ncbi:MAG: hypothetical protein B7W98_01205 [Parcubacteria group bacterium 20-58-5]|nr:MAG: hypothetical protein B7W98_01205 [Parcubacteria group bacterium 20-58-5]OYV63165.1 MAG: hypothetical protein B7X03_02895 [Parcubacteria group bacterium 21-58-10]
MRYGYTRAVPADFDSAIANTKEALAREGFGVLTEIDVKATLKKKLDVDVDRYVILGACNPSFAHNALQTEPEIGLLLPCNVIVYEKDGATHVSAIAPTVAMGMVENEALQGIAGEVEEKLRRAVDSL